MALILAADDDEVLVAMLQAHLESAGHRVVIANDGPSVTRKARESLPDLMILDLKMPGLSGAATFRALDEEITRKVPVIFISGLPEEKARRQTLLPLWSRGRFLVKPLDFNQLDAMIDELLKSNE
ncbi:MAG: response regulator [Elusimicrobiota bacterium]